MTAPVRTVGVKFTATGSETVQRAIAQVTAASTAASDRASRAASAAATRTMDAQRVTVTSYERVVRAAERAAYAENAIRQRAAQAARSRSTMVAQSMATSMHMISETGQASGDVIRRVATDVANLALMMGVGGPLMLSIGLAGMAVVGFFNRAREERRKLEEEAITGLKRLQNAGDLEGMKRRLMDIDRGTPGEGFKDSLAARRQAIDDRRNAPNPFGLAEPLKFAAFEAARTKSIKEEEAAVEALAQEYERLKNAIINFQSPNTLPTTTPITIRAKAGRRFPEFKGAPWSPREQVDMSALEEAADKKLRVGVINPLGDPEKFRTQLSKELNESIKISERLTAELVENFSKLYSPIANAISGAILGGIAGGIAAAITSGSIGEGIRSLAQTVLAGLGDMFAQIAVKAIAGSALMIKFMTFLTTNPWAALAAATAIAVLARSIRGSVASVGSSGAVGGLSYAGAAAGGTMDMSTRLVWGNNSVATAAGMTPRQANNITIIGPDDPRAQRAINELLGNAEGRGLPTTGGRGRRRG